MLWVVGLQSHLELPTYAVGTEDGSDGQANTFWRSFGLRTAGVGQARRRPALVRLPRTAARFGADRLTAYVVFGPWRVRNPGNGAGWLWCWRLRLGAALPWALNLRYRARHARCSECRKSTGQSAWRGRCARRAR